MAAGPRKRVHRTRPTGRLARYRVHPADMGSYDFHLLAAQPIRVLLLMRAALERSIITPDDAAEISA
jgi:hypothetical protein